jgi:AcrR family transcriptional regulator
MTASAPRTARERARAELTQAIKDAARQRLAAEGAPGLSLRAVARDLGMVPSALYRYFANRDELLTALIIEAFDALGEAAEVADAGARESGAGPGARWLAVCRAVRGWAREHPHEFALVYGSPVPGYQAPADTVGPASRIPNVLGSIVIDAASTGSLHPPARPLPGPRLVTEIVVEVAGGEPASPYDDLIERTIVTWITLVGAIAFELFGHLNNVVTDYDTYFDAAMAVSAEAIGLELPRPPRLE